MAAVAARRGATAQAADLPAVHARRCGCLLETLRLQKDWLSVRLQDPGQCIMQNKDAMEWNGNMSYYSCQTWEEAL